MSESLRGHFLIAGCRLRDPSFFKTAVLIVEHGDEGAMGLIINRPLSVTVSQALTGHIDMPDNSEPVYSGGPVEPAALFVIHDSADLDPAEDAVVPGLYMGSSPEVFENIVCHGNCCEEGLHYRVFCGCAGWAPGQLEAELSRGDWLTLPAKASYVFQSNPYSIWDELLTTAFASNRFLKKHCDHPEWN